MEQAKKMAAEGFRGHQHGDTTSDDPQRSAPADQMQDPGAVEREGGSADDLDEERHLDNEAAAARDYLEASAAVDAARSLLAAGVAAGASGDAQEAILGAAWAPRLASIARHDGVAERFVREVVRHLDDDAAARLGSAHPALARPASHALAAQARADAVGALEQREAALREREDSARALATVAAEMLSRDQDSGEPQQAFPVILWDDATAQADEAPVIDGMISRGDLCAWYGAPKSGKTFLGVHAAACIGYGRPFFGHAVDPGLVIYVAAEMGGRAQRRALAWRHGYADYLGEARREATPVAIIPRVVNLMDTRAVNSLLDTALALIDRLGKAPRLVVVDTLARSLIGGDENTAKDMGLAVAAAMRMRDRLGLATLLIHHSGKDVTKGARGSNALLAAVDMQLRVEKAGEGRHLFEVEDSRNGDEGIRRAFTLPVVELVPANATTGRQAISTCYVAEGGEAQAASRSARVEPTGATQRIVLQVVREVVAEYGEPVPPTSTIPPGRRWVKTETVIARAADRLPGEPEGFRARGTVKRTLKSLQAGGFIGSQAGHVWAN